MNQEKKEEPAASIESNVNVDMKNKFYQIDRTTIHSAFSIMYTTYCKELKVDMTRVTYEQVLSFITHFKKMIFNAPGYLKMYPTIILKFKSCEKNPQYTLLFNIDRENRIVVYSCNIEHEFIITPEF